MNIATNRAIFQPKTVSRRSILRGIPAAAALSVTASAAVAFQGPPPAHPDPLPGWFEEWKEKRTAWADHPDEDSAEAEALWNDRIRLDDLIAETTPTTREGIAAKLEWVLEDSDGDLSYHGHHVALKSALDVLKRGVV